MKWEQYQRNMGLGKRSGRWGAEREMGCCRGCLKTGGAPPISDCRQSHSAWGCGLGSIENSGISFILKECPILKECKKIFPSKLLIAQF